MPGTSTTLARYTIAYIMLPPKKLLAEVDCCVCVVVAVAVEAFFFICTTNTFSFFFVRLLASRSLSFFFIILAHSFRRHTLVFIIFYFMWFEMRWNELIVFSPFLLDFWRTNLLRSALECSCFCHRRRCCKRFAFITLHYTAAVMHLCRFFSIVLRMVLSMVLHLPHISIYLNEWMDIGLEQFTCTCFSIFFLSSSLRVCALWSQQRLKIIKMKE